MRQLPRTACAYLVGFLIAVASVPAFANDIGLTVDLLAPNTACSAGQCPTDINLPQLAGVIGATSGVLDGSIGTAMIDQTVASPVVCSEQTPNGIGPAPAPNVAYHFSPVFNNAAPNGGPFEFDAGGASVVDSQVSYDGILFAATRLNTASSQVACYPINALGVTTPTYALSSVGGDRIFLGAFDGGHSPNEPWVSVQTVNSLAPGATVLGYVAQIHNASKAVGWHLSFGYDHSFNKTVSGIAPNWYVLGSSIAQPGAVPTVAGLSGTYNGDATLTTYFVRSTDIQSATNSVYIYVRQYTTNTFAGIWSTLPSTFYSASAAAFAPPGTYAQRLDDKVSVAGAANVPTQNIGSIICSNDPAASQCTLLDQDGNPLPSSVTFKNQVNTGAVTVDPVAYVVDPNGSSTLPSTTTTLGAPTAVSCTDPNGILASLPTAANFIASINATGARSLNFNFKTSGSAFVPGTATCTATFTSNGLPSTQSFSITMQQLTVTHFDVTANDSTIAAGTPTSFSVSAKDANGTIVTTYGGAVAFSSTDTGSHTVLPSNSSLVNGSGSFQATLTTVGTQTITATDTTSSTIKGTTTTGVAVTAASATSFVVSMNQFVDDNTAVDVFVQAVDTYGNEATAFNDDVHVNCTNCGTPPADAPLSHQSHGTVDVTFNHTGSQSVTVNDVTTPAITGTASTTVE